VKDNWVQQEIEQAKQSKKANKKLAARLKKRAPRDLDEVVRGMHEETFEEVDCLDCANCCKTTSPIFRDIDIERLSKHLRLRPTQLIERHLYLDEEEDYVLNTAPCPFLGKDNYCSVYEARPQACREYPHTNRKRFHQILDLSVRNTTICPAVARIFSKLGEHYK